MKLDVIVSLCKRRGFIFQSSEIYGGIASCWDYGPLGVELKNNVKRVWWRDNVYLRPDMVGLDAAILMHPKVWKASGHLDHFTDPMVDCKACRRRFRADQLDATPWIHYCPATKGNKFEIPGGEPCKHCGARRTLCPACGKGELTPPRQFNLMFKTFMGPVEEDAAVTYLRPETAQGIFVNFDNVLQATRLKLPFGIAQIGKSFRNEITPGNFIFRTHEFEQMEIEYFVNPSDVIDGRPADEVWHERWIQERLAWYERYGIRREHLRLREHEKDELAHYAKPSAGADRSVLAFLVDAYREEEVRGEKRVLLRLHADLAPVKIAVLPLLKKRDAIVATAREIQRRLARRWVSAYDDTAAIGRLYRRQDEVGTPYCVTVDVQTVGDTERGEVGDGKVTIRERDSMEQIRVPITELETVFRELLTDGVGWSAVRAREPAVTS